MVKSEKVWLDKVTSRLTMQAERVAELQRFCEKFAITNLRPSESLRLNELLSYDEVVGDLLEKLHVYASIGEYTVQLFASRRKNKPYISLEAQFEIENRKLKIYNKRMENDLSKSETRFSDESHQIASVLGEILGMEKVIVEELVDGTKMAEALIVRDDKDSIVVAYNT